MALSGSNLIIAGLSAVAAFGADQLSKAFVTDFMGIRLGEMRTIIDGFVTFTHTKNYGINFGLFQMAPGDPRPQYVLIGFSVIVSLFLLIWTARRASDGFFAAGAGMVVGGALANALDRLMLGAVTDFLNVTCCGKENPFAFNIADVAIFAGVALLLWRTSGDDKRAAGDKTETL